MAAGWLSRKEAHATPRRQRKPVSSLPASSCGRGTTQHKTKHKEIADPSADNIKKHEYATAHFKRLNQWLEKEKIPTRYQFNMISPKSYNVFFQNLRDGGVIGFRSDLDVAMTKAAKADS